MFGLFKSKGVTVLSPTGGEIISLESVNDEVFSQKMVGDGIAIIPHNGTFVAPFDGEITKLFSTLHAYSIKHKSGLEVIVHIGLETVSLAGDGFEALVSQGEIVKAGEIVIKADLEKIKSLGKDMVTPIVITQMQKYTSLEKYTGAVESKEPIMEVK